MAKQKASFESEKKKSALDNQNSVTSLEREINEKFNQEKKTLKDKSD
jgi:hypothetical protein